MSDAAAHQGEVSFRIVRNDGDASITVFTPDGVRVAANTHPNWDAIVDAARNGQDPLDLINGEVGIRLAFEKVTDRVALRDGVFYFDGDPVHSALAETVVRFWQDGDANYLPLVLFFEKVMTNPDEHTRENLFRWLQNQSFHINEDGNIVGYKGVNLARGYDLDDKEAVQKSFVSVSSGPAIIDGREHLSGPVPNTPGSVIEMARSNVEHNPSVACSTGLHVGTWSYAANFGSVVLAVEVNPRDVVSVPTDCNGQKLRTCRYTVIGEVTREHDKAAWDGIEVEEPEVVDEVQDEGEEDEGFFIECAQCGTEVEDVDSWDGEFCDEECADEYYETTGEEPDEDETSTRRPWWKKRF